MKLIKTLLTLSTILMLSACNEADPGHKPLVKWPTTDVAQYTKFVTGYDVEIPAYNKAYKVDIDTTDMILEGYFGIYCYTDCDSNPEETYSNILKNKGWEVESEKVENFYNAYDPDYKVWLNFGYDLEIQDFEIYVTKCEKTKWPEQQIANYLQILVPGTQTVIPKFEAYTTKVNFYDSSLIRAIAINAYGFSDTIIEDYKTTLTNEGWAITYNDYSKEWNAISKDGLVELHFYIDSSKVEFNVDVLEATVPVKNWPYQEIENVITDMGATGEVIPFRGECTGFAVQPDWLPPVVQIFCSKSQQESYANEYNQALLDLGYKEVKNSWDEDCYAFPGTTLAYRAVVVVEVLEIELFKLANPA